MDDAALLLPDDPRHGWDLPPLGAMPRVEQLDEAVVRVLAPNPSPMTLDGTNTYVVGGASASVLVVDPGPDDPEHLARVMEVVAQRDAEVAGVVVTHHHRDHAAAADDLAARLAVPVIAATSAVAGPTGRVVGDGDRLDPGGFHVEVVATPGHTSDHVSLRLGTGAVLTGDHVLGRGTTVVTHPDGDLLAYLASLRRLLDLGPDALYPGHGPALTTDPAAVLEYHLAHREVRERQIMAALAAGPADPAELVTRVYVGLDPGVRHAAEASTRATLAALLAQGRVRPADGDRVARIEGA